MKFAVLLSATCLLARASPAVSLDSNCCRTLASQTELEGKVYRRDSSLYNERMTTYFSLSAALEPWCIILPESAKDVSAALKIIDRHQCPFGLRSGGHGTHALSNSVSDGVTIDLGFLNKTTFSKNTNTVSVGTGASWGSVYDTLTPHGVTVTGARASTVGVGGFLTGSGYSFHAGTHGFGCDQVRNYEVVLSDGRIVNANVDENRDLWQVLKGGGGNFGIITRFDLNAIDFADPADPSIWGGPVAHNNTQTDSVIKAFVNFASNVAYDPASTLVSGWAYNAADGYTITGLLANTANVANASVFDEYRSIAQTSSRLQHGSMTNLTALSDNSQRTYTIFSVGSFKVDARLIHFIVERFEQFNTNLESAIGSESGMFSSISIQPVTAVMISHGGGNNVLGLERHAKEGPGFIFQIYAGVHTAEHEVVALAEVARYFQHVSDYAASLDATWGWLFLNYAGGDQDVLASYGETNIKRMRAASKAYDPNAVFQTLRRSGFKIPQQRH